MKNQFLYLVIIIPGLILALYQPLSGQSQYDLKSVAASTSAQKTANSKDILTTFFQAGIDNLFGNDHTFRFNSSFYGIDSVFRKRGTSIPYQKERALRQISFNIGITGDENYNIDKIDGGFTFTIINMTDIKLKKIAQEDFKTLTDMQDLILGLKNSILSYIATKHPEVFGNKDLNKSIINTWNDAARTHDFSELHLYIKEALSDPAFLQIIKNDTSVNKTKADSCKTLIKNILNGEDPFHKAYVNIAEKYARKPLWTFSPTAVYDFNNNQGEYTFASIFTVGIGKNPKIKPWELEIKSQFIVGNDTSVKEVNYENKNFTISLGVNKVLIQNQDRESKMEFKLFTQYDYQFGNVPEGMDAGIFTLDATLQINVFKGLWLPLTLQYDPKNANFLGYFAVTANLGN
jgi:hypothetical protein